MNEGSVVIALWFIVASVAIIGVALERALVRVAQQLHLLNEQLSATKRG
jgi:hypothetical protein